MGTTNIAPSIAISTASIYISPSYLYWGTTTFTLKITYTNGGTTTQSSGVQVTVVINPTASISTSSAGTFTYSMPPGNYSARTIQCAAVGGGGGSGGDDWGDYGGGGPGGGGYSADKSSVSPGQTITYISGSTNGSSSVSIGGTTIVIGYPGGNGNSASAGGYGSGGSKGSGTTANGTSGDQGYYYYSFPNYYPSRGGAGTGGDGVHGNGYSIGYASFSY
jgi:hypothetical protein